MSLIIGSTAKYGHAGNECYMSIKPFLKRICGTQVEVLLLKSKINPPHHGKSSSHYVIIWASYHCASIIFHIYSLQINFIYFFKVGKSHSQLTCVPKYLLHINLHLFNPLLFQHLILNYHQYLIGNLVLSNSAE